MKNYLSTFLFLNMIVVLVACQSGTSSVQHQSTKNVSANSTIPPGRKSSDGVQEVTWNITAIDQKRAKFFNHVPFIRLSSSIQTVQGHTGCNVIFGTYKYQFATQQLTFDTKAGYDSCDGALAQEAEIMDALQRIKQFRVQGNTLYLVDQYGKTLIQAQK